MRSSDERRETIGQEQPKKTLLSVVVVVVVAAEAPSQRVLEGAHTTTATMFRVRATSFFTGFAAASGIAMYQLQRDVWGSHHILADEVEGYYTQLERRIQQLEVVTGVPPPRPHQASKDECQ